MEATTTQASNLNDQATDATPTATAQELALAREVGELRRELEAMTSAQRAPDVTF
jgi:hypothetical protein